MCGLYGCFQLEHASGSEENSLTGWILKPRMGLLAGSQPNQVCLSFCLVRGYRKQTMKRYRLNNPDRMAEDSAVGKSWKRERMDLLRSRVDLLSGRDKALMQMRIWYGASFRQLAIIARVNDVTIARRIHKLTGRLLNSEYITCLRNRERFTRFELVVARDTFLMGISQRIIAAKHDSTVYTIRATQRKIRRLLDEIYEQVNREHKRDIVKEKLQVSRR